MIPEFPRTLGLSNIVALQRQLFSHHIYQMLWKQTLKTQRRGERL